MVVFFLLFFISFIFTGCNANYSCVDKSNIEKALHKVKEFQNSQVIESKSFSNELCEITIKNGHTGLKGILYISKDLKHLYVGNIIEINTERNLTREKFFKLNPELKR